MLRWFVAAVVMLTVPTFAVDKFDLPAVHFSDMSSAGSIDQRLGVPVAQPQPEPGLRLTDAEARWVGDRIFENECSGLDECLTSWNRGEDFASMSIGHLLWYRKDYSGPFTESFPALLRYLEANGVVLPDWLKGGPPCPWNTRAEFEGDQASPRMRELRAILVVTKGLQARFIADRAEAALPKILDAAAPEERERVRFQFYRVARAKPTGVYALVDYVNFKGEGINPRERYNGQGWGLLQVLAGMIGVDEGAPALAEFANSARGVIDRRIANSPPSRNEGQWRAGWMKRIETYRGREWRP